MKTDLLGSDDRISQLVHLSTTAIGSPADGAFACRRGAVLGDRVLLRHVPSLRLHDELEFVWLQ